VAAEEEEERAATPNVFVVVVLGRVFVAGFICIVLRLNSFFGSLVTPAPPLFVFLSSRCSPPASVCVCVVHGCA